MSYVVVTFLPVWAEGDCIGVRLHSCNAVIEFVLSYSFLLISFTSYIPHYTYVISAPLVITINIIVITLVQRYTKNITSLFPSVLYKCPACVTMPMATTE